MNIRVALLALVAGSGHISTLLAQSPGTFTATGRHDHTKNGTLGDSATKR